MCIINTDLIVIRSLVTIRHESGQVFGGFLPFFVVSNLKEIAFCYVAQKVIYKKIFAVMLKHKCLMLKNLFFDQVCFILFSVAIVKKALSKIAIFQYLATLEL